jgi:RNA polymerase sigma-70 factor (ECF subfamily)
MSGALEKKRSVVQKPDTVLVKAAINGNADSFTELCRRYYPAMVAIAHSVLGDRHLAEDAAQQAFAKAALKLPQLN